MNEIKIRQTKILVISGPAISPVGNTGRTLFNLFKNIPPEYIFQIYFDGEPPDKGNVARSAKLGSRNVPFERFVRSLFSLWRREKVAGPSLPVWTGGQAPRRMSARIAYYIKMAIRAWFDCFSISVPSSIKADINKFDPQVIYVVAAPLRIMNLAIALSKHYNIKIVPHFMDDWPSLVYGTSILEAIPRWYAGRVIRKILRNSYVSLCISKLMAEEYSARYQWKFLPVMNCIDDTEYKDAAQCLSGSRIITYVGGTHLNRIGPLIEIAEGLQRLRKLGMMDVRLVCCQFSASESDCKILSGLEVELHMGVMDDDQLNRHLTNSMCLLHVEPKDEVAMNFLRLSLSTKIPLYLSAGRPILYSAASHMASARYIHEAEAGFPIESCAGKFEESLHNVLLSIQNGHSRLSRNAWECARINHFSSSVRKRFGEYLGLNGDMTT